MSVVTIQVNAAVQWLAQKPSGSKRWIAECVPLGIAVAADSLDELPSLMNEATHLLFVDLAVDQEFDQFLRERGWTAQYPAAPSKPEKTVFRVPMDLVIQAAANGASYRTH